MTSSLGCLAILLLLSSHAAAASSTTTGIVLAQGRGYPICRAIVAALRKMPPNTPLFEWAATLPAIQGVTKPNWISSAPPLADASSADVARKLSPSDGQERIEETTVPNVYVEGPWTAAVKGVTTDIHFVRREDHENIGGTISYVGSPFDKTFEQKVWHYDVLGTNLFSVTPTIPLGGRSELEMFLVDGQPWFVQYPAIIGTLETIKHLTENQPSLLVKQKCLIRFPVRQVQ